MPGNRAARISPLVPGVDLAGVVVASADPALVPGTEVLAHGHDLGVARHGGFAAWARLPAGLALPLPAGLSGRQAMIIGTAGFTAALSVNRLERHGLAPGDGPVLVTGASGGVGIVRRGSAGPPGPRGGGEYGEDRRAAVAARPGGHHGHRPSTTWRRTRAGSSAPSGGPGRWTAWAGPRWP